MMDSSSASSDRQAVWTRHWASGAAHSCAGSYGDTYGGEIARFWQSVLAATPPGARMLDVASGSGALPRLLMQLRPDLLIDIDAVDIAAVAPAWVEALPASRAPRVRFHPGVAAESLPFDTQAFDLVVSQYGLEYADAAAAVPELLRVLAPGGRAALVLHHVDSRPVSLARIELGHLDWLRGPEGLLPATRAMFALLARATTPAGRAALANDPAAEVVRQRFNAAQDGLRQRRPDLDGGDVLHEVQDSAARMLGLAGRGEAAAADRAWIALDHALSDATLRLQELRACALSRAGAHALCRALGVKGGPVELQELRDAGYLMGWALTARP